MTTHINCPCGKKSEVEFNKRLIFTCTCGKVWQRHYDARKDQYYYVVV